VILVERSGDADDDGVHLNQAGIIGGCGEALLFGFMDFFRGDAVDVRSALGEGFDFTAIDVEAGDGKLLVAEQQGQRKSHVAEADDADACLALLDLVLKLAGLCSILLCSILLCSIFLCSIGGTICGWLSRHRRDSEVDFVFDSSTQLRAGPRRRLVKF